MGALIRIMVKHVARRFGTTLGECFRCVAGDEREAEIIAFSRNLRALEGSVKMDAFPSM